MRIYALLLSIFVSLSCGQNDSNRCESVVCTQGFCDLNTGECANPASCKNARCVKGFRCQDETCLPNTPCDASKPCEKGQCFDGGCINLDACTAPQNCIEGYLCEKEKCVENRCDDTRCARGVCDLMSAKCINEDICTRENQAQNCIDGYYCYGQKCTKENDICDDLRCVRGICDPAQSACINDPTCADDSACLESFFCDQGCQKNQCKNGMCSRGLCENATGDCVNASPCNDSAGCTDGFLCVSNTCLEMEKACGEMGCQGNQLCDYDSGALNAECTENNHCRRALDCLGERVCKDRQCATASACVNDSLEPNDTKNEATRISKSDDNYFDAQLCTGDVDHFVYDVNDSPVFSGTLVVSLQISNINIGNGMIRLKVRSPSGEVKEALTTLPLAHARIEFNVGALDRSDYLIEVIDESIESGGVAYQIFAEVVETTTSQACAMPTQLQNGQRITANTADGASFGLGSTCTQVDNPAGENIYFFTIDSHARVLIKVEALNNADLSFSVREICENNARDLECVENTGPGQAENLSAFLNPGGYYLIVQGSQQNTAGSYKLSFTTEDTLCNFGDATCESDRISKFCASNQTEFQTRTCQEGCDPMTGFCLNEAGDTCMNAIDTTAAFSDSVVFTPFSNDYEIPPGGCLPDRNASTSTDGPDVAYAVHLDANQVLSATLDTTDVFENTSLYLVSDCTDPSGTCLAGSNRYFTNAESLTYKNETQNALDLFLIADVEKGNTYGPTTLNILVEDLICLPNSTRCAQNTVETCNALGTAYDTLLCTAGCDVNTGDCILPTNDSCSGAIQLTAPMTLMGRIGEFTNLYTPPSVCTNSNPFGKDAVYSFTTTETGKVAQLNIDAQFDASIYVVEDCDNLTSCQGSDKSGHVETFEFLVNPNTTYYIIIDSKNNRNAGEFTLSFDLKTPSCTPNQIGTCQNAQDISFCSALGIVNTHTCLGGCSNGTCTTRSGDSCFESILATTGQYTGSFSGSDAFTFSGLDVGQCSLSSIKRGNDTVYEILMNAGDSLFADLSAPARATMYLLKSCLEMSSCESNVNTINPSLSYTASVNETVFLVVDRDTTFSSSAPYTLDLRVGPPDCIPGASPLCDLGNSKIIYCDTLGFSREHTCAGACTAGHCDTPQGDVCIDAIPMIDGQVEMGSLGDNNPDYDLRGPKNGRCRSSSESTTVGKDTVYSVNLNPGDFLEATLNTQSSNAQMYFIRDCDDLSTCLATHPQRGSGTISYLADSTQTLFIIVDSISTFTNHPYTLKTTIQTGLLCKPDASYCVGSNVEICDALGSGPRTGFFCGNSCAEGGCNVDPASDLCLNAPFTSGIFVYDSLINYSNDILGTPGCSGISGAGPDVSYSFQLSAGEVFHAKLESLGREALSVSLLRDCNDPAGSCLAGQRTDPGTGKTDLYYTALQNESVTLVVDSTSNSDDDFSLLVESLTPQCTAASTPLICMADSIRFCNAFGIYEYFDCDGSCANARCQNPSGASCIDPLVISDSVKLDNQRFDAPNEIELLGAQGACNHSLATRGYEKIYTLDLQANETVEIQYQSMSSSTLMYLLSDCAEAQSCLLSTGGGSRKGALSYRALSAQTLFLVVDRTVASATSLGFSLDIQFRHSCNMFDATTCVNPTRIEGCASDGLSVQSDCSGACLNGSCTNPSGQFCSDPIALIDGGADTRSFDRSNSMIAQGNMGTCTFSTETNGKNYIYSIDLLDGDTLNLDYLSDDSLTVMYLLTDCHDLSSCSAQDKGITGSISYTASQNETIFVVMDQERSSGTATYTLNSNIFRPNCNIGDTPTCSMTDEVSYCVDQLLGTSLCTGCVNGTCPTPAANNCVDLMTTQSGALIQGNFAGDNALTMLGDIGTCHFSTPTEGVDHFYTISLLSGQTLTATYSSNSSLALLYLMGSCFDRSTCFDNTPASQTGSLSYTATQDEDVVLVMDRSTPGSTSTFTFDLSVRVN